MQYLEKCIIPQIIAMKKGIFLLTFLLLCSLGYAQKGGITSKKAGKFEESQNQDFRFYCDNEIKAYFPAGTKNWMQAVTRNFRMDLLTKNKIPKGTYKVLVTFMVTKSGKIDSIMPDTHFGYGIEDEIIRAIKKCAKWVPATNSGKKINSYQIQPVTIIVK
jgi:hypothetical protein